ncbi:phosphoribosylglycinamide formyltransferase [Spirulina sp. CS-785/01]|uniref:phosphoribosylglycinamide formyltransferase n=1 Tax=Spirulina sp. CS-785/01 TaxID=3021716 RepID=UPI00232BF2E4|nr:phosphoribosylglycinamide formyltransferase [Spirulina sp. CS-785/01]MDB9314646.1 phosphoribosylglycinamide formyltransferase [Spirulina sp. CS-785/01]
MTAYSANSTPSFISPSVTVEDLYLDSPLRLGVLASGSGSNFEAIAQAIQSGQLNATIPVLIYNKPKAKVTERAKRFDVPAILHNHRAYQTREALDEQIVDTLKSYRVDWVIMAGWMRIVTPVLLNAFPHRVLNIHPSLLPSFPGIHGIEQALNAGVKVTGCTVHLAQEKVDSGPIIMQAAVPILPDDTPDSLHQRVQVQEHQIFPQAIALAAKGFW